MQAIPSPMTRVLRLQRQYISAQISPISQPVRQVKPQGQRSLQGPAQGWQTQLQRWPRRGPTTEARLQTTVLRLYANIVAHGTNPKRNAEPLTRNVSTVEDLDTFQSMQAKSR